MALIFVLAIIGWLLAVQVFTMDANARRVLNVAVFILVVAWIITLLLGWGGVNTIHIGKG